MENSSIEISTERFPLSTPHRTVSKQSFAQGLSRPLFFTEGDVDGDFDNDDDDDNSHEAGLALSTSRGCSTSAFLDAEHQSARDRFGQSEAENDELHVRQEGGKAVIHRRVNYDKLSEEDQLIKELKDRGVRDDQVVEHLIKAGLTRYVPKSINTRYYKIKSLETQRDNFELDEDLTDWHEGDDDLLDEAKNLWQHKFEREMELAVNRYYNQIASNMHAKQGRAGQPKRFSATAIKARDEALQSGTALPPLEQDPDQDGRLVLRGLRATEIIRIKDARIARQWMETNASNFNRGMKALEVTEKKRRIAKRHKEARLRQEAEIPSSDHAKRLRDVYYQFRSNERTSTGFELGIEEQDLVSKLETFEFVKCRKLASLRRANDNRLTELNGGGKKKAKAKRRKPSKDAKLKQKEKEIPIAPGKSKGRNKDFHHQMEADMMSKASELQESSDCTEPKGLSDASVDAPAKPKNERARMTTSVVTEQKLYSKVTPENPRSHMSLHALRNLCKHYGLSSGIINSNGDKSAKVAEKSKLVYALAARDSVLSLQEIKNALAERDVHTVGSRNTVLQRIAMDDAGRLVGGSDFYESKINPYRRHKRSFGSLSPASSDGEDPTCPKTAR